MRNQVIACSPSRQVNASRDEWILLEISGFKSRLKLPLGLGPSSGVCVALGLLSSLMNHQGSGVGLDSSTTPAVIAETSAASFATLGLGRV